jgi:hypothetical protein
MYEWRPGRARALFWLRGCGEDGGGRREAVEARVGRSGPESGLAGFAPAAAGPRARAGAPRVSEWAGRAGRGIPPLAAGPAGDPAAAGPQEALAARERSAAAAAAPSVGTPPRPPMSENLRWLPSLPMPLR